ncbi:MAG: ribonuclease Z [Pyrinomonadaceae bacterium]
MKFIVIGSGTSVPHPFRTSSAYWVETEKGSLMLDFSPSAIHRLAAEKLDWKELDAIWISHFHLDHCGGLAPFLFGTKYARETQNRRKPLKIFGPAGLQQLIKNIDRTNDYGLLDQPFPVEIVEVEPLEKFRILEDLEAVSFDTPHTPESRAIRLSDSGKRSIVFTSDTGFSKAIGSFAKNADLFVVECSFVKDKPVEKHLELSEAIYLARYSNAKKTVLTHLYPEWDDVDIEKEIAAFSPKSPVITAEDGLRIKL